MNEEMKQFLIDLIEENFSPDPIEIGSRWQGGSLILKPGSETKEKEIPIEVFFKKLLSVRDSLRVLEQKLNTNSNLSSEEKASFHAYITKAYGSLTSFNILFKENKDKFIGSGKASALAGSSGSKSKSSKEKFNFSEAKENLGMKIYGED